MTELDFCKLEVTVIHSLQTFTTLSERFANIFEINLYFETSGYNDQQLLGYRIDEQGNPIATTPNSDLVVELEFDNTMLDCELKVVDSTLNNGNTFEFNVWNIPKSTVFANGDYLLFKWYWVSDPTKYTIYHGCIGDIKVKRVDSDLKTTIKGELVHQNILYNWSIYNKYPVIKKYRDVFDFIVNELELSFSSTPIGWEGDKNLPEAIFTKGKTVGQILDKFCLEITQNYCANDKEHPDDECHWKLVNGNSLLIYKTSDLDGYVLNNEYKITVPSVSYNDLLTYDDNTENYEIEVFGIPTLKSGIVFYVDCTGVPNWVTDESAYFVAEELEHTITCADGYIVRIYARKIIKA